MTDENRIALIHRVMIPDRDYPKEYAILVTNEHLILIRQEKVRSALALREEMRWGSEIASPVVAKTLKDYEGRSVESLSSDLRNITISNESITEMSLVPGGHKYRSTTSTWRSTRALRSASPSIWSHSGHTRSHCVRNGVARRSCGTMQSNRSRP